MKTIVVLIVSLLLVTSSAVFAVETGRLVSLLTYYAELKQKVQPYIKELQARHILALNAGLTVIRLLPPLVITYEQIDHLVDTLRDVLSMDLKDE